MELQQQIGQIFKTFKQIRLMSVSSTSVQSQQTCAVCYQNFNQFSNSLLKTERVQCQECAAWAHKYCYTPASRSKIIKCQGCQAKEISKTKIKCCLCFGNQGFLKKIRNSESSYGHVICLLFSPYFLIESYRHLSFISIETKNKSQNFICSICWRSGTKENSCCCAVADCHQAIHWRCLFKNDKLVGAGFWTCAVKKLNFLQCPKISLSSFYRVIEDYLNKYFEETIFQTNQESQNLGLVKKISAMCPKHSKNMPESCKCERRIQSGFILCDFCGSLNHLKCEHKMKNFSHDHYKCLQCQDWGMVIRKKKRPYLNQYPNMNIYDYIYIQCFYEENGYRLAEREPELLCRLPTYPSLQFLQYFSQNHASKLISTQVCVQQLREEVENQQPHILNTKQVTKNIKLVKVLTSDYKKLPQLKQEFRELTNSFNITHQDIIKTLKEYDRKILKNKRCLPKSSTENLEEQTKCDLEIQLIISSRDDSIVKQVRPTTKTQSQSMVSPIQIHHCIDKISLCKQEEYQFIEEESEEEEEENSWQHGDQSYILKEIQQIPDKQRLSILDWERDLLLRKEQKEIGTYHQEKSAQILQLICQRSLEMDLTDQNFSLSLETRIQILEFLKLQSEKKNNLKNPHQKVIKIQENLTNLMISLNKIQNKEGKYLSFNSDLNNICLGPENTDLLLNFFHQSKGVHLKKYDMLRQCLKQLGEKLIQNKKSIETCRDIDAYEVIAANFRISNEQLEKEIQKKAYVEKYISRVVLELEKGELKPYFREQGSPYCLSMQILQSAAVFSQLHGMEYYLPKIEKYMAWIEIYQDCILNIPKNYLSPAQAKTPQYKKLNGQIILRIHDKMKDSNFPSNRIQSLVSMYAEKYRQSRQNLVAFLQIFEMRIKKDPKGNVKYAESQILKWMEEMMRNGFEADLMTRQVEQIVHVFRKLKLELKEVTKESNQQQHQDLLEKIETIPIIFDTIQSPGLKKQQQ